MDSTPNKVLESVVRALGGSKQVAPLLWPDKSLVAAQTFLCDCLNDERPAKLDFSQVLYILKLAKAKGIHSGMEFICADVGYTVGQPIDPKDEATELIRQYMEIRRVAAALEAKIDKVVPSLRVAA